MALGKGKKKIRSHSGKRGFKRIYIDPKNKTRDIDQVQSDIEKVLAGHELPGIVDADAPGGGLHYCVPCARHFVSDEVLKLHMRSKPHKKRLRLVAEPMYTHAEAAAGAGVSVS